MQGENSWGEQGLPFCWIEILVIGIIPNKKRWIDSKCQKIDQSPTIKIKDTSQNEKEYNEVTGWARQRWVVWTRFLKLSWIIWAVHMIKNSLLWLKSRLSCLVLNKKYNYES